MDASNILQAISTVGFPIVMCLVLLWYIYKLTVLHKEESTHFTEALNKNTSVLERICNKLDVESEVK